jgi:hypothetical protein
MAVNGYQNGTPSSLPEVTYGFIGSIQLCECLFQAVLIRCLSGIGVMGFPMARNIRAKIPSSSRLVICEVVEAQIQKFLSENKSQGEIQIASTPREVAEQAVGRNNGTSKMLLLKQD